MEQPELEWVCGVVVVGLGGRAGVKSVACEPRLQSSRCCVCSPVNCFDQPAAAGGARGGGQCPCAVAGQAAPRGP